MRFPLAITLLALLPAWAEAHFLMLLPEDDVIPGQQRSVRLEARFTHPMAGGPLMQLERPQQCGVLVDAKRVDLLSALEARKESGKTFYEYRAALSRPADHVFYFEPAPYWEPNEKKLIVHYTKVVVSYAGAEEGWDALVGFPVEIRPLVRPYGLWAGNCFRGVVLKGGKPLPYATVEVEYNNADQRVKLPNESFFTQVLQADSNGVFCYSMPRAGWWGFAALADADQKQRGPQGTEVDVELGGLMWVKTVDMR